MKLNGLSIYKYHWTFIKHTTFNVLKHLGTL